MQPLTTPVRRAGRRAAACAATLAVLVVPALGCASDDEDGSAATTSSIAAPTSSAPATSGAPATAPTDPVEVEELPFVGLDESVDLIEGVSVVAISTQRVQVEAIGPGDTTGPGFAVTLAVTNDSTTPFDLDGLAVNATTGPDRVPALPSDAPPAVPARGEVAPGERREAVLVFRSDAAPDETVELSVATDAGPRVARISW